MQMGFDFAIRMTFLQTCLTLGAGHKSSADRWDAMLAEHVSGPRSVSTCYATLHASKHCNGTACVILLILPESWFHMFSAQLKQMLTHALVRLNDNLPFLDLQCVMKTRPGKKSFPVRRVVAE